MTRLEITKKIVSAVVGAGTGKIVGATISNNMPDGGIVTKITVVAASLIIGMMASEATSKYTDAKIDEIVAMWKQAKAETATE
jgi:hypothetical protein